MLDTDTKRRIDTARDILVGKVPDPKSQVEQITIAMIYKFMDDMDAESERFGGERSFFTGEFARFGWANLMRPALGGHEMLSLYGEGIDRMPENPGIPFLFREIFKNAYLPYRDPETLKAFLKIINEFNYDHSERLGDAFEYLLSVLGSQGDAGQFRTPRHIIDFIVEILDPKKNESVLDPACGTAGFLISSYKHILKSNIDGDGNSTLTPDDRGLLSKNFSGYDISPDMVRLSLVNLYLHGFTDPHIYEYDTLTSEERWKEHADVILANPPFMSPKGGIKPHRRFSIQAKRSEVLFVDYIAEHLSTVGRAGIIVPEGIIFQSQAAYKDLRKLLVDNSLVAVISLPAGCFNPYSGVKTSILILDKSLAKQSSTIAFFKVKNDGFGLGAQRRIIEKDDLPQVKSEIGAYFHALRGQRSTYDVPLICGLIVSKEKIASNGDYNLNGERYREEPTELTTFVYRNIGEIADEIKAGFASGQSSVDTQGVPHIRPMNITEEGQFTWNGLKQIAMAEYLGKENYALQAGDVLFNNTNSKELVGKTCFVEQNIVGGFSNHMTRIRVKPEICLPRFLAILLHSAWQKGKFQELANRWVGQAGINANALSQFQIPLPSLWAQKEIVKEIEGYQTVIRGARAVLENYSPYIPINPDWPKQELGSLAVNLDSRRVPITKSDRKEGPIPYYGASGIVDYVADYIFDEDILLVSEDGANLLARSTPIAFSVSGKCWVNNHAHVFKFKNQATQKFVEVYLNSISIEEFITGSAQPKLNQEAVHRIPIPIPNEIHLQNSIIEEIRVEQTLVSANRELIDRFQNKIQEILSRVWGEKMPNSFEA